MFGKNSSSSSSSNVEVNVTLDVKNATFSGVTTFDSPVINNSTLTQIDDASFENLLLMEHLLIIILALGIILLEILLAI